MLMPCSSTPAGPIRQALRRHRHGPRYVHNEGSHDIRLSGLNSTASALAAYASQDGLLHHHARLASRCRPLYGTGLITRRIPRKVSKMRLTSHPPSSSLPGARTSSVFFEIPQKIRGCSYTAVRVAVEPGASAGHGTAPPRRARWTPAHSRGTEQERRQL